MNEDKRASQRVPIKLKVDCQVEGNFLFEYATNLSQHGIFVESKDPLEPGTQVHLQFHLPDSDREVEVEGEVMWINPTKETQDEGQHPGMGIRFTRIQDLDKDLITEAVKRIAVL